MLKCPLYCSVLGRTPLITDDHSTWTCLTKIAQTAKHIAYDVKVSAICKVDEQSGLPEFPIKGNVVFTQRVISSLSAIDLSGVNVSVSMFDVQIALFSTSRSYFFACRTIESFKVRFQVGPCACFL